MRFVHILFRRPMRATIAAVVMVGLFLTGCDQPKQMQRPMSAPQVTTVTVQSEKIMLTTELPGRTSAYRIAEIRPQVSGLIQRRLFTEGSDVKAGQVLYQIDPSPFQAALANAEAARTRAEANLPSMKSRVERYEELVAQKAVSQQDYDDAAAALTQVEADIQYWKAMVETARINLGYTKVIAPISGRIGKSNVTEGAIVTAYQPMALTTIQQLDPIYADVPQSTTELLRLKNGGLSHQRADQNPDLNKVKLILEDGTPYPQEGTLQFSDVTVDPTTGSVILRVVFPNPNTILLPGMFVRAVVKEGVMEQAILVPQQGVSRDNKGNPLSMIVGAGEKVEVRMLTLDRAIGNKWLIASGLAPGDRVIVEGLQLLRPGTVVKAVPFDAASSGPGPAAKGSAAGGSAQPQKRSEGGA